MVKNQKGFTLVEVIVVAVIVAVLAAVAVPLYNGYIKDSRMNVVQNFAGTVATAISATNQQGGTLPADGPYASGALLTFTGQNAVNNTLKIPNEVNIVIADPSVTVIHNADATVTATKP